MNTYCENGGQGEPTADMAGAEAGNEGVPDAPLPEPRKGSKKLMLSLRSAVG